MRRIRTLLSTRHSAERAHTVCVLCVIQYLLIFGATQIWMSVVITTLVFVRDVHLSVLTDSDEVR